MKRLLCKIFGHKWIYSFTSFGKQQCFRNCKRCAVIAEYKEHAPGWPEGGWFNMVQFTDKGAKEFFERRGIKL